MYMLKGSVCCAQYWSIALCTSTYSCRRSLTLSESLSHARSRVFTSVCDVFQGFVPVLIKRLDGHYCGHWGCFLNFCSIGQNRVYDGSLSFLWEYGAPSSLTFSTLWGRDELSVQPLSVSTHGLQHGHPMSSSLSTSSSRCHSPYPSSSYCSTAFHFGWRQVNSPVAFL